MTNQDTALPTSPPRPGAPVWLDLMTHDVDAAMVFYGDLFGWTFADQGADVGHYHLITKDGRLVGGLMSTLRDENGPAAPTTTPAMWNVYLRCIDIDATLARLPAAGAGVVFGPMDIADQGRQAFVVDPAGARLGLWQPANLQGFAHEPGVGTPVWFEVLSKDFDAALPFYRDVLGWDISWMPDSGADASTDEPEAGGFRYVINGDMDSAVAGLCDAPFLPDDVASFWRVYVGVADADAAADRIVALGGTIQEAPADSPFGRFAQVADPQGAIFMINQAPSSPSAQA